MAPGDIPSVIRDYVWMPPFDPKEVAPGASSRLQETNGAHQGDFSFTAAVPPAILASLDPLITQKLEHYFKICFLSGAQQGREEYARMLQPNTPPEVPPLVSSPSPSRSSPSSPPEDSPSPQGSPRKRKRMPAKEGWKTKFHVSFCDVMKVSGRLIAQKAVSWKYLDSKGLTVRYKSASGVDESNANDNVMMDLSSGEIQLPSSVSPELLERFKWEGSSAGPNLLEPETMTFDWMEMFQQKASWWNAVVLLLLTKELTHILKSKQYEDEGVVYDPKLHTRDFIMTQLELRLRVVRRKYLLHSSGNLESSLSDARKASRHLSRRTAVCISHLFEGYRLILSYRSMPNEKLC